MDLPSAFNWNFDLHIPRPTGTSLSEFWFCFVLMNFVFLIVYLLKDSKTTRQLSWCSVLLFCLYAFWDTDYFSFARNFYHGLKDFRDPIYYYISLLSCGSYIIFRLFVWGAALIFVYLTAKRLKLNENLFIYVFTIFFMLTFSYARVSLAMALYFYGASFLVVNKGNILRRLCIAAGMFALAYISHRSVLVLIALSPLVFFKLTKKRVLLILLTTPFVIMGVKYVLGGIISGALLADNSSEFAKSAQGYASSKIQIAFNWKWELITTLRYYSFYIALGYAIWKFYFRKNNKVCSEAISRYLTLTLFIVLIAITILGIAGNQIIGLWVIGYRYLYMAGIPLCLIITYMYQNKFCSYKVMNRLLLLPFLYGEIFMLGKIITMQFGKM
ncbi:MAG: EpsG family protein [Muribaculaceae bacterium]|nr:EpsG family protein [Muribaculaceae bacterium]